MTNTMTNKCKNSVIIVIIYFMNYVFDNPDVLF